MVLGASDVTSRSSGGCSGRQRLPELWEPWNLSRHSASIPDRALGTREQSDFSICPAARSCPQDVLRALGELREQDELKDAEFKVVHTGTHKRGLLLSAESSSSQSDGGGGGGGCSGW